MTFPSRLTFDGCAWADPTAYYTGPVDADLSGHPNPFEAATAIFTFAAEAQTTDRASMRTRWADYRGKVPPDLARNIIDDIEARGATCSKP